MLGLADERGRWLMQASAELMYREGNVGASRRRCVHQAAGTGLHLAHQLGVLHLGLRQRLVDVQEEVARIRQRVALSFRQRAVGL